MTGTWLSDEEQATWRAYLEMQLRISSAIERNLAESGLSQADYALMVPLSEAENGELRARDLARWIGWDRSRLSHQIRRMEERGMITRRSCPTDGRGTMLALTPRGRATVEATAPGHVATVRSAFIDQLAPDDHEVIQGLSHRVVAAVTPECTAAASVPGSPPQA
jgi:DNA-binding MarR family transcriptional regulator